MVPMFALLTVFWAKTPLTSRGKTLTLRLETVTSRAEQSPCVGDVSFSKGMPSPLELPFVIPAQAGTQSALARAGNRDWVPACAGMTNEGGEVIARGLSETARVGKFRVRSHCPS